MPSTGNAFLNTKGGSVLKFVCEDCGKTVEGPAREGTTRCEPCKFDRKKAKEKERAERKKRRISGQQ